MSKIANFHSPFIIEKVNTLKELSNYSNTLEELSNCSLLKSSEAGVTNYSRKMVSSRIVDLDENVDCHKTESISEMTFAAGEEPVWVRVLTYQSSRAIKRIVNALEDEEVGVIRESSFGKIIEIAKKPAFSRSFVRYIISRQMKIKKKRGVWFRFAGQRIWFLLKEFVIVTGLP